MIVKVKDEAELVEIARELLHCMVNLRHWTKLWERDHGSATKASKKAWEIKADELLEKLAMEKSQHASQVKIEIKNDQ